MRVPAGNRLPDVPPVVDYGELVWRQAASGSHAGAEVRHAGRVFVNEGNVDSAVAYTVTDLPIGMEGCAAGLLPKAFVRVDDVTDLRYAGPEIVAETRGRYFVPALERSVLIGLTASASF